MRVSLGRFWNELQRRHVVRVATVYAVVAWGAVQVVATVVPLLQLPEWPARVTVICAIAGFPVVVVLTWIFDVTSEGIRRTAPLTQTSPETGPATMGDPSFVAALGSRRAAAFVGVGILIALASFAAIAHFQPRVLPGSAAAAERIESIAVLPFVDLSPRRDQEYFSDGITEELLNRLAQIDGLRVPARTSAFAFKGKNEAIEEIARRLKVQAIVEGSVRRDGDNLRITAQLIDARTGYHLWSADFDRKAEGVFAVQDEIATAIVSALRLQLAPASTSGTEIAGTSDPRAHELYLLALSSWHKRTPHDLLTALEYFKQAVDKDPSYAQAYAGLAETYAVLPIYADFPAEEAVSKGNAAAARALSLNAMLSEAHAAMGQLDENFEWDMVSAEASYRRALGFNASYAPAHGWLAEVLLITGRRAEARGEIDQALALDPLSAPALNVKAYIALVNGDVAASIDQFNTLTSLHPSYAFGQLNLAYAAILARRFDIAQAAVRGAHQDAGITSQLGTVVQGIADPARRTAALSALATLDRRLPPAQLALWLSALGEKERAIAQLQRAVQQHVDGSFPLMLVHPLFVPLRADARFRRIAAEVGAGV